MAFVVLLATWVRSLVKLDVLITRNDKLILEDCMGHETVHHNTSQYITMLS